MTVQERIFVVARNDERITRHGKQIDDHEHRITVLEQEREGAHEQNHHPV